MTDPSLVGWLLDSDPALRWQVERDLVHAPEVVWAATRARDVIGAGPDVPQEPGQPWTATTWSLNALREWGLDASALAGTTELLAANSRWEYEDLPYWGGEVDCCINAWTVANGVWFGADVEGIVAWFVEHQLVDGGWNCEWVEGSTRSSFHSTLNAVVGLLAHEVAAGGSVATRAARHAGEEYLLARDLLRRRSTGELVRPWAVRFAYPFRWACSVLRVTDHLRRVRWSTARRPTPAPPRRSSSFVPLGSRTAPGSKRRVSRAGRGSRWTWERASRRRGSPSTPCAC